MLPTKKEFVETIKRMKIEREEQKIKNAEKSEMIIKQYIGESINRRIKKYGVRI